MSSNRAPFITDLGPLSPADIELLGGRFGVWLYDSAKGKHQVSEVGNDLAALMAKHNIPAERVLKLKDGTPSA
jgi:hypothetical protein